MQCIASSVFVFSLRLQPSSSAFLFSVHLRVTPVLGSQYARPALVVIVKLRETFEVRNRTLQRTAKLFLPCTPRIVFSFQCRCRTVGRRSSEPVEIVPLPPATSIEPGLRRRSGPHQKRSQIQANSAGLPSVGPIGRNGFALGRSVRLRIYQQVSN